MGKNYFNLIAKIDYPLSGGSQQVASMFVVNAQNSAPTYESQINSGSPATGALFTLLIELGTFKDAESDTIFYQANLKSSEPLPHWAYFFPISRTFRIQGTYTGSMEFQVRAYDKTD